MSECPKCQLSLKVKMLSIWTVKSLSAKVVAVTLYTMGLSLNSIARLFKVFTPAVLRWVKIFAEKVYEKPEPREAAVV